MKDDKDFGEGKAPRLEISMLPRDVQRVTGDLRRVLITSFNYARLYPAKLDKFIEVMKYVTNYALKYKHFEEEKKRVAAEKMEAKKEVETNKEEVK